MIITKRFSLARLSRTLMLLTAFLNISLTAYGKVTIKANGGLNEIVYVSEADLSTGTAYKNYNYLPTQFAANHDGNPVTLGYVFEVVQGDPSIILYAKSNMPSTGATAFAKPTYTASTKKLKLAGSAPNNSIIGIQATYLSFALSKVPEVDLVLKLVEYVPFIGANKTDFAGDGPITITFKGGSATPEYEYGGLKQTVTTHYGGYPYEDLLATGATDKATWVSGPIHPHDGTDEIAADDFDPELHRIVAPAEADNENESPVMVDRARFNLSFVVNLHPDNTTATRTAITTLELRDADTDKYLPLTTGNNTPVYYQVSPLNAVHPDEATRHNPSTLPSGAVWGFASDYHWADEADKTTSATVEIPVGLKINDDYVKATRAAEGRIGNVVTYVLDAPVAGEKAAAIASGNAQAGTDYIYKVAQPIYMSTTTTGVENVAAENDTTEAYFTLQGIALPGRPTTPGLYICRRGGEAKVVAIH